MVRNYIRLTDRQSWSVDSMKEAVSKVVYNNVSLDLAADQSDVPKSTLARYVKKARDSKEININKKGGKFKCVFTENEETELANYFKDMEKMLFGLNKTDLRKLAYQLASRIGLKHNFNNETKMAGQDWVNSFLKRQPSLSIKKPEVTSGASAMRLNQVVVSQFHESLKECIDQNNLTADKIYNCDEICISVIPKGISKIIDTKEKRTLYSADRVTAELCFSASGAYMPPMLVFPRKKKQQYFEIGLPPGGWAEVTDSGCITKEKFVSWFKKFVKFSGASKESPVLLLLDGRSTYTKNIELIDLARNNSVILICYPPHCSHRLQPLHVSFIQPISTYYEQEVEKWLTSHPGKSITLVHISTLFGAAYENAATLKTAMNGFRAASVWPPDITVFQDDDFLPSAKTDIKLAKPQCSWMPDIAANPSAASNSVSPKIALLVPEVELKKIRTSQKKGKTANAAKKGKRKLEFQEDRSIKNPKKNNEEMKENLQLKDSLKQEYDDDATCLYCNNFDSTSNESWIECSICHKRAHSSCTDIDTEKDDVVFICKICST